MKNLNKKLLDLLIEKKDSLKDEELSEIIGSIGPEIFDNPEIFQEPFKTIIAKNIPFSERFIEKIVSTPELIENFWKNDNFEKEKIEDLSIAKVLFKKDLLKFEDLDSSFLNYAIRENLFDESFYPFLEKIPLSKIEIDENPISLFLLKKQIEKVESLSVKEMEDLAVALKTNIVEILDKESVIKFYLNYLEMDLDYFEIRLSKSRNVIQPLFDQLSHQAKEKFALISIVGYKGSSFISEQDDSNLKYILERLNESSLFKIISKMGRDVELLATCLFLSNKEIEAEDVTGVSLYRFVEDIDNLYVSKIINKILNVYPVQNLKNEHLNYILEKLEQSIDQDSLEKFLYRVEDAISYHFAEKEEDIHFSIALKFPYFKKYIKTSVLNKKLDTLNLEESIQGMAESRGENFDKFLEHALSFGRSFLISNKSCLDLMDQEKQSLILQRLDVECISNLANFSKLSSAQILEELSNRELTHLKVYCLNESLFKSIIESNISQNLILDFINYNSRHFDNFSEDVLDSYLKKIEVSADFFIKSNHLFKYHLLSREIIDPELIPQILSKLDSEILQKLILSKDIYWNKISPSSLPMFSKYIDEESVSLNKKIQILDSLKGGYKFFHYQEKETLHYYASINADIGDFKGSLNWSKVEEEDIDYWISKTDNVRELLMHSRISLSSFEKLIESLTLEEDFVVDSISNNLFLIEKLLKSNKKENIDFAIKVLKKRDRQISYEFSKMLLTIDLIDREDLFFDIIDKLSERILPTLFVDPSFDLQKFLKKCETAKDVQKILDIVERNNQVQRKIVRLLKNDGKQYLLPEEFITTFELLEPNRDFNFYQTSDNVHLFSKEMFQLFEKNVNESDISNISDISESVLLKVDLRFEILQKVLINVLSNELGLLKEAIENSVNSEKIKSILCDESVVKKICEKSKSEEIVYILYDLVENKKIFKNLIDKIEIDTDFIDKVKSGDLLFKESFLKRWRDCKNLYGSDYKELPLSLLKEIALTIEFSEVSKDNCEFEKNGAVFKLGKNDLKIVEIKFDKTTQKYKATYSLRKELNRPVVDLLKEVKEKFPLKILGKIDLEGEFEPKDDTFKSLKFNLDEEDRNYLKEMKDLGVESGEIKAEAIRMRDLSYQVIPLFEKLVDIDPQAINHLVKDKTFSIEEKLNKILKVDSERQFGFELELGVIGSDRESVSTYLRKKGFKTNLSYSYGKSEGFKWDFKTDGSLETSALETYNDETDNYEEDGDAFEIASPILKGKEGILEAQKFLKELFNRFDAISGEDVNGGLHVHHDINDFKDLTDILSDSIKEYIPFQNTLYDLVEGWRNSSPYCEKVNSSTLDVGRFHGGASGVIITSFGTLEFRMKEGVVNEKEIIRWIIFTQKIVEAMYWKLKKDAKKIQKSIDQVNEASLFMILENQNFRGELNRSEKLRKIKNARKLVGLQNALSKGI